VRQLDLTGLRQTANRDATDLDLDTRSLGDLGRVVLQDPGGRAAHNPAAE
jgi:hypothetical protein